MRNNQRRSRARRREYVAELERRLQEYEVNGVPTLNVVPQDTILRLEDENRKLRELLDRAGVELPLVGTHLNHDDGAPAPAPEVTNSDNRAQSSPETALEDLVSLENCILPVLSPAQLEDCHSSYSTLLMSQKSTVLMPTADGAGMPDVSADLLAASFLQIPMDEFSSLFDPVQANPSFDPSSTSQSFAGSPLPLLYSSSLSPLSSSPLSTVRPLYPTESSLLATSKLDSGTTLCSVAYELVRQHNKRGVDMIEIGIRLWNGFVKGDEVGGCKVENKLLFSVLEYISG